MAQLITCKPKQSSANVIEMCCVSNEPTFCVAHLAKPFSPTSMCVYMYMYVSCMMHAALLSSRDRVQCMCVCLITYTHLSF